MLMKDILKDSPGIIRTPMKIHDDEIRCLITKKQIRSMKQYSYPDVGS